jgi:hypothetical protein
MDTRTHPPGRTLPTIARVRTAAARRTWLTASVAAVALALTIVGAAALGVEWWSPDRHLVESSTTYHHAIDRVELDLDVGDVTLVPGPAATVEVSRVLRWTSTRPAYSEDWTGDTLRITSRCPAGQDCSTDDVVQVPTAVAVVSRIGSGDLSVTDVTGPMDLRTGTGAVAVDGARAGLRVRGGRVDVTAGSLGSTRVRVEVATGDISLDFARAPRAASATAHTGDIAITAPPVGAGYRVRATTGTGDRDVSVATAPAARRTLTATTGAGDIRIAPGSS